MGIFPNLHRLPRLTGKNLIHYRQKTTFFYRSKQKILNHVKTLKETLLIKNIYLIALKVWKFTSNPRTEEIFFKLIKLAEKLSIRGTLRKIIQRNTAYIIPTTTSSQEEKKNNL